MRGMKWGWKGSRLCDWAVGVGLSPARDGDRCVGGREQVTDFGGSVWLCSLFLDVIVNFLALKAFVVVIILSTFGHCFTLFRHTMPFSIRVTSASE